MHKSKVVNTKRERRSSNNKTPNNNSISKQPLPTPSSVTLGALVTGFTSPSTNMSVEANQAETFVLKPTTIELPTYQGNGTHSPSKSFSVKDETLDEQSSVSSTSHIDHGVDSGLSSELTNPELEKTIGDDEFSSTSGTSSTVHQVKDSSHRRESSPTSGVIIPEEKRVTDRVKVFEAVANNNNSNEKGAMKNGNKKKSAVSSSFSAADQKPVSSSSIESFDTQSMNESKGSKNKSKKSSLKKQIQNLLKIDKTSLQDDLALVDEQLNGKKNKKDINSSTPTLKHSPSKNTAEPLEIQIPATTPTITTPNNANTPSSSSSINHDIEQTMVKTHSNPPTVQSENPTLSSSSSTGVSQFEISNNPTASTAVEPLPSTSPKKSIPTIVTHSPMSSGVADSMKTSTHSVSTESHTRNRSPMQRYGPSETSNTFSQSTNGQVTDNLRVQHQREKQELAELNDRFRGYLDRVKILEGKNSNLTGQLEDVTKSWGITSKGIISQYSSPLDRLRQEVNESMIDEADLQTRLRRSLYDIDNYRSLIHDETMWNDRQIEKREQLKFEYEHSCSELSALQRSYQQVEEQLKHLLKQREDQLQEIDQLNEQSYHATLERIKLDLQVQTLREEIPFLNDVHAHLLSEFEQLKPTNGIDTQLFYRQELEKAIRDIRRDFETLHSAQRKEMEDYYTVKISEIQNDAKRLLPSQTRQDDLTKISEQIKTTKFDLNDTQKLLIQEKEKFRSLQEQLAKLEEEYGYVSNQRNHANDDIHKDLLTAQERIQQLTAEIDSILRSNITLESEINIYRRLLDSETNRLTQQQTVEQVISPEPAPPSFGSELGKVFNKKIKKGPIAIKDCAPDGKCITLENSSIDKDVDVSNWILKRRVEGSPELSYTIPFGLTIKRGNELKIFARSAQNAHHRPPSQVVNDKLDSWGMGTECETKLFNEQGEEKASHSQKIVFGSESSRHLP